MKIKTSLVLSILLILPIFSFAQQGLDFNIPAPEASQLAEERSYNLGSIPVKAFLYDSTKDEYSIIGYYQNFFNEHGFEKVSDKRFESIKLRIIKFKKEDLIVSIAIESKFGGAKVVINKYLQTEGSPSPEEQLASLKNSPLFSIPKEDQPGKDLSFIPRPPDSVRWLNKVTSQQVLLIYSTVLPLQELKQFYLNNMPSYGWQLTKGIATKDTIRAYDRVEKQDPQLAGGLNGIMKDGEDITQVASDSYVLGFRSQKGTAKVIIYPNFVDRKLGSMVYITYSSGG